MSDGDDAALTPEQAKALIAAADTNAAAVAYVIPDPDSPVGLRIVYDVRDCTHDPTMTLLATINRMLVRAVEMAFESAVEESKRETKQ